MKQVQQIFKWMLVLVVGLVLGYAISVAIGTYLPERYEVQKRKSFQYPLDLVWRAVTEVENYPNWKPDVRRVEMLGRNDEGLLIWREYYRNRRPVTYEIVNLVRNRVMEVVVSQSLSPVQTTWEYRFTEQSGKKGRVGVMRVRQVAIVEKPFSRFEKRFVLGPLSDIDSFFISLNSYLPHVQKLATPSPELEENNEATAAPSNSAIRLQSDEAFEEDNLDLDIDY